MPTLFHNPEMHMELIKSMAPLVFVALVYVWFQRRKQAAYKATWVNGAPPDTQHCMTCGEDSPEARGALRGNTWIEVLLWVCLLWPSACAPSVGVLRWCLSPHRPPAPTSGISLTEVVVGVAPCCLRCAA